MGRFKRRCSGSDISSLSVQRNLTLYTRPSRHMHLDQEAGSYLLRLPPLEPNEHGLPERLLQKQRLTRSTKKDNLPGKESLQHSFLQSQRNSDTRYGDEVMPARMPDPGERVHLGVDSNDAGRRIPWGGAVDCSPGSSYTKIVLRHFEAMRRHERRQGIMGVSENIKPIISSVIRCTVS